MCDREDFDRRCSEKKEELYRIHPLLNNSNSSNEQRDAEIICCAPNPFGLFNCLKCSNGCVEVVGLPSSLYSHVFAPSLQMLRFSDWDGIDDILSWLDSVRCNLRPIASCISSHRRSLFAVGELLAIVQKCVEEADRHERLLKRCRYLFQERIEPNFYTSLLSPLSPSKKCLLSPFASALSLIDIQV